MQPPSQQQQQAPYGAANLYYPQAGANVQYTLPAAATAPPNALGRALNQADVDLTTVFDRLNTPPPSNYAAAATTTVASTAVVSTAARGLGRGKPSHLFVIPDDEKEETAEEGKKAPKRRLFSYSWTSPRGDRGASFVVVGRLPPPDVAVYCGEFVIDMDNDEEETAPPPEKKDRP